MIFFRNDFLKNNFTVLLFQVIPIVAALIFIPKNIEKLGVDSWGVYTLATTTIFLIMYFNLGLGPAVNKSLSFYSEENQDNRSTILQTGLFVNLLSSIIIALILYLFNEAILNLLSDNNLSKEVISSNRKLFNYAALASGLYLNVSYFRNILESSGKFIIVGLMRSTFSTGVLIAPYFFNSANIHLAMVCVNIIIFTQLLIYTLFVTALFGRFDRMFIRFKGFKAVLIDGIRLSVHSLINPIFIFLDRYLIGILVGLTAVGIYTSIYDLISRITIVASAFSTVIFPEIARYAFNYSKRLELIKSSIQWIIIICIIPCIILFFLGEELFAWWLNVSVMEYTMVIKFLTTAYFIQGINLVLIKSFQSSGYINFTIRTSFYLALLYAPTLYICIKNYGVQWAAIILAIKNIIEFLLYASKLSLLKVHKING